MAEIVAMGSYVCKVVGYPSQQLKSIVLHFQTYIVTIETEDKDLHFVWSSTESDMAKAN